MYKNRCIDKKIKSLLNVIGAVNIKGIKGCGKTTTAFHFSKSQLYLQDPYKRDIYQLQIKTELRDFLDKTPPLLIDEWQEAPVLWDAVRFEVDKRSKPGQFILTASTSLIDSKKREIKHSGIGRIAKIEMLTMSLYESGDSNGSISLANLFENKYDFKSSESNVTVERLAYLICIGGWPSAIYQNNLDDSLLISKNYYNGLIDEDMQKYDGIKRDKELCKDILASLARNISTSVTTTTITKDVIANNKSSEVTIESYISVLKRLYIIMNIESWRYQLRSSTAIRQTSTRYFTDPSIATSALGITPEKLLNDFNTFGLFFENLCVRDLTIYANSIDANIYKYQDRYGLEIDSIIELQDDTWGAFEIKLGEKEFEKAAKNLNTLNSLMIEKKKKPASFLAILTGTKFAYKRDDGVLVIPIGCLKD